ncbi:MAG: PD40 domain-containing protein, partial [Candidatus Cloacimonetes bacterium]|nr:PD40 domain-containing protein [Candidatus Cloacimonadota bacterium]
MNIKKILFLLMVISFCILNSFEPRFMITPAISPAGTDVCFSFLGDLWLVPVSGGTARRLTAAEGKDWNPAFSPDGEKIVFNSDRDGWTCIYQIPVNGGKAEVISRDNFLIQSWFPDNKYLLVSRWEPGLSTRFFKLKIKDNTYQEISGFAGNHGTVSRDGKKIIFDRQGLVYREAYQGSFNGDLWQLDLTKNEYSRLTETPLTEQYPLFASIADRIYFTASDGSDLQLWSAELDEFLQPVKLTKFKNKSVREPDL